MSSILNKKIRFFLLVFGAVVLPQSVFASTAYIDTNHKNFFVDDTISFNVRIDSEKRVINAVDGEVLLKYSTNAVSLVDMNTSGSAFSLWPTSPSPSEDNTSISFVGGSPGGLLSEDAIVFNFVLKLKEAGQITLSPSAIGVYLHDGKGTKDEVRVKDLVLDVLPRESTAPSTDDWGTILSTDKTAPEPFEITFGKDPSVFENRYFLSFFATDAESGVAFYEVQEGDGAFVRAKSPYVLKDQSLHTLVRVKAIDKAGNERIEAWSAPPPGVPLYKNALLWIIASFIILLYALWKIFRRKV